MPLNSQVCQLTCNVKNNNHRQCLCLDTFFGQYLCNFKRFNTFSSSNPSNQKAHFIQSHLYLIPKRSTSERGITKLNILLVLQHMKSAVLKPPQACFQKPWATLHKNRTQPMWWRNARSWRAEKATLFLRLVMAVCAWQDLKLRITTLSTKLLRKKTGVQMESAKEKTVLFICLVICVI